MHFLWREVDVPQYLAGGVTLAGKHVEQRGKLGRFVDTLSQANEHVRRAARAGLSEIGGLAGLLGLLQLSCLYSAPKHRKRACQVSKFCCADGAG
jgi:hypothetical protein